MKLPPWITSPFTRLTPPPPKQASPSVPDRHGITRLQPVLAMLLAATAFLAGSGHAATHTISGTKILKDGVPTQWRGVNVPNMTGPQSSSMAGWGIDIVREYITDVNNVPTGDTAIQDPSTGQWIHGLRKIVNDNRLNGKVTILCPFAWNLDGGWEEEYCGKTPRDRWFFTQHVDRLRAA
ncbi:MAG: hypothetical protein V4710_23830, partial [Verrucomicrobiota bacterium]